MSKNTVNKELFKLSPSTIIELFELDTTNIDGNRLPSPQKIIRFHNYVSEGYFPIFFDSVKYIPIPVQFKNNETKGDGTALPRPRLNIGNADGMVSYYISMSDSLIGAKLLRRRTYARFLSGETWGLSASQNPFGTPDGEAYLADDVFLVDKIISENKQSVEFELACILELNDLKLPRRRMWAINCGFEYRNSTGCDYTGVPSADATDKKFTSGYNLTLSDKGIWNAESMYNKGDYVYMESSFYKEDDSGKKRYYFVCNADGTTGLGTRPIDSPNWILDVCSRKINGCLCRNPSSNLPFGGFPALIRVGFNE